MYNLFEKSYSPTFYQKCLSHSYRRQSAKLAYQLVCGAPSVSNELMLLSETLEGFMVNVMVRMVMIMASKSLFHKLIRRLKQAFTTV